VVIPLQPGDCWTYGDEPSRWYDLEDERLTRYSYDALNRRVSQTVTISGVGSQSTRYVLDGMNVAEEHRGSVTLRFVHGFGVDEHVLMDNAGTRHYYVQDRLGSVVGLTDSAGGLVEAYLYQPYGELTVIQGGANGVIDWGSDDVMRNGWGGFEHPSQVLNPYYYTGQPYDASTGLYYYRARYYDPAEGRFLTRDPIGVWGDAGNLGNAYAYVALDPLNLRDPSGMWIETAWDFASIGFGIHSLSESIKNREWGWAVLDGIGIVIDGAAAVLPFIPAFGSSSVRGLRYVAKYWDDIARQGQRLAEDVSRRLDDIGERLGRWWDNLFGACRRTCDDLLNLRGVGGADEFADAARRVNVAPAPKLRPTCFNSFLATTLVGMADNSTKSIEWIQEGDWVWAIDPETGARGPREVVGLIRGNGVKDLVTFTVNGDRLTATSGHPFWVNGRGWVDAGDVRVGDSFLQADGGASVVEAVEAYSLWTTAYNFEVEGLHTYLVEVDGEGVVVHNCKLVGHRVPGIDPKVAAQVDETIERAASGSKRFKEDGKVFKDHDLDLDPMGQRNRGYFTEWTVAPAGADRGLHRIIIGGNPSAPDAIWYWNHGKGAGAFARIWP
jgi:RHS repeat-associated protein